MTIKELIEALQDLPPEAEVSMRTSGTTIDTPVAYVEVDRNDGVVGLYE